MLSKNSRELFHATMNVTRVEEWFVEAGSAEKAKELLESGQGERRPDWSMSAIGILGIRQMSGGRPSGWVD